ncbi:ADOP family duplicated permease [Dokdonella immobilis]|uniref:Putative ABC transport system permease protein n=1 Tax=Dokdonella immobilis TaxID=578942 RepID=A0A1I4ZP95_9GAMM|nr:ADOP family duplicated permease [Dokdonella immobilis]SFN51809.1 putative ABC transport system permease protein [Dokdonella immobilis]
MHAIGHELKQATRGIANQPGFSLLVVGVLAAGLSAVIYMLIAIGSMILRPLPFADADRLHTIGIDDGRARSGRLDPMRDQDLVQLRRQLEGLAGIGGFGEATINLSDLDRPERFDGAIVSGNFFSLLGVAPALGRDFTLADERDGAPNVVMLSKSLWKQRYAADPDVIGRRIRVNSAAATIVGVMPEDFSYPRKERVWMVGHLVEGQETENSYTVLVRRHAGASVAAVEAGLAAWVADAARSAPARFRGIGVAMEPLAWLAVNRTTRAVLGVMLIAVILVLLVACSNAANLLLTRTLSRRQELAVRLALGASRGRLTLHLLTQSVMLTLAAVAIAIPLACAAANWTERTFRLSDDGPPHWLHFTLDANALGITLVVAALTALAAGLLPALRAGREAMTNDLRAGTRSVAGGGFARISRLLVVGEVALSCVLLIMVGTLVRGISSLDHADTGIDPGNLLTARVGLFPNRYPTGADQVQLFEELVRHLREDPAVVDATATTNLPAVSGNRREFLPDGAVPGDESMPQLLYSAVDDRFLETYALALRDGRFFDARDTATSTPVAVVDESFAERFGDQGSVLGRRFRLDPRSAEGPLVTVVGVVARVSMNPPGAPQRPALLVPLRQQPARFVSLAIRTSGQPAAFAPRLATLIREVDADTPAYWVRSYEDAMREATFAERLLAKVFAALGVIALVLAAAGLYGVMAFNVGQRTREIGVRRALGAPGVSVLRDLLLRVGSQLGVGLGIGLALGLPFARSLSGALPTIGTSDGLVVCASLLVLTMAAVLAVIVPARRALRIDPMVALRHE